MIKKIFHILLVFSSLILIWQLVVSIFSLPVYILPGPLDVAKIFGQQYGLIASQAVPTIIETLLGLFLGTMLGITTAITLLVSKKLRWWILPLLLISQAIPTFAIAPLFVIWFGYGMTSKIITTIIMLFFPITSAFYDGLRSTPPAYLELAKTMNSSKLRTLLFIQIPAGLPGLASGLRVAATIAPIGAIVGEWVGASSGLGYLILNANARMQISLMFAALIALALFTLLLYFTIDKLLKILIPWKPVL